MDVAPSTKTKLRYKTYNDTHTTNYSPYLIVLSRFILLLEDMMVVSGSPALRSMREASGQRWEHYLQQWRV